MGRVCRCICQCDKNCRLPACICADCGNVSGFDGGRWKTYHMGAKIKSFIVQMLKLPEHIFAVMLCPFGAFCYMTFLRFFCGDVWAYKNVQIAWREVRIFRLWAFYGKRAPDRLNRVYLYGMVLYRYFCSVWIYALPEILFHGGVRNHFPACAADLPCHEHLPLYSGQLCRIYGRL